MHLLKSYLELLLCQAPAVVRVHLVHDQLTVPGPGQEVGPPTLHAQPHHQDLREGGQLVQVDGRLSMDAGPDAHVVH